MFRMKDHLLSVVLWEIKWNYAIDSVTDWDINKNIINAEGASQKPLKLFKLGKETNISMKGIN